MFERVGVVGIVRLGVLFLVSGLLVSCSGITDFFESDEANQPFLVNGNRTFTLQVRYEQTAAPFVGNLSNGRDIWSITAANLRDILPASVDTINVPNRLSQMTALRPFNRTQWTKEQLTGMAFRSSFGQAGRTNNTITAVFLHGSYVENPVALGIHFENSAVVFIFKDVINRQPLSNIQKAAAEQTTIVHELGHALGLVNGFVPMTWGPHEDSNHPNHCTNTNCIMFRQNDGSFALNRILNGRNADSLNLFGPECLTDLRNFYNRGNSQ